jgi:hypothetical protein
MTLYSSNFHKSDDGHGKFRWFFLVLAFSAAIFMCGQAAVAQTPTIEQLYKMLLKQQQELSELKSNQVQMKTRAERAEAETRKVKNELEVTRAALESAQPSQTQQSQTQLASVTPNAEPPVADAGWKSDVRAIYLFNSKTGADPAMGNLSGPIIARNAGMPPDPAIQGTSHNLSSDTPDLDGGGVRVSLLKQRGNGWFSALGYEGHFVDGSMQRGHRAPASGIRVTDPASNLVPGGAALLATDTDAVHANLVNRTLADNNALNDDFDSGLVDYARDTIDINKHNVDFALGKKVPVSSRLNAFWKTGVRLAHVDAERDVLYENSEPNLFIAGGGTVTDSDWAEIAFKSDMWGAGPMVGFGGELKLGRGITIASEASLSGAVAYYDLKRNETNFNSSLQREAFSNISADTYGFVPMVDASIDITKTWNDRYFLGFGYTVSAWLGGARSISIPGWDDVDDETTPFTIESDDLITQGIYVRAGVKFGHHDTEITGLK